MTDMGLVDDRRNYRSDRMDGGETNLRETGGMAAMARRFDQYLLRGPVQAFEPRCLALCRRLAQSRRPLAAHVERDLRHPRRRGAGSRAVGEDVRVDDVAIVDPREAVGGR